MTPEEEATANFRTALLTLSELIERHASAVSVDEGGLVTALFEHKNYTSAKFEPSDGFLTITLNRVDGRESISSISDGTAIRTAWAPVRRAITNWMNELSIGKP